MNFRLRGSWMVSFLAGILFQATAISQTLSPGQQTTLGAAVGSSSEGQTIFSGVTVVTSGAALTNGERSAVKILTEEVQKRTGLNWQVSSTCPAAGDVIILKREGTNIKGAPAFPGQPELSRTPESFRIVSSGQAGRAVVLIEGRDGRGVMFGVGKLLRMLQYNKGSVSLKSGLALAESPAKEIRGHQLGYRNTANSYDGWTPEQFEQYIRELVIFGANSIESIPIFKEEKSPHFKIPPDEMNSRISAICDAYDLDYWMWVPAQIDLNDKDKRRKYLETFEKICNYSVRINGVFFPGGDPGDNPPELVMPLLEDMAVILKKRHPRAGIWLSLQNFTAEQSQYVYKYVQEKLPVWLGGLVTGPSSPPVEETRAALPSRYKLRYYPDLTHNVRCDSPIPWWDPAFNLTLGREAVNPRPYFFSAVYKALEQYTDGFISYSDGCHDDVNKIVWTRLSWDPHADVREILTEYSNFFFGSALAEDGADAILGLEKNWEGPMVENGNIQSCLETWKGLESANPDLAGNWRWQMCLLRAYYDAYTRKRFIYEDCLEREANEALLQAGKTGPARAMETALSILARVETNPVQPAWHKHIIDLCDALYKSISLQTSVAKYKASGEERGAVLDFLDRPLNNRWWLEDEFKRIGKLPEQIQVKALDTIANWENPGPGGFYDDIGNVSKSPHVYRGEPWVTDPLARKSGDLPGYSWWDNGFSRQRLSWMTNMGWPLGMEYNGLDSTAHYTVRITGYGETLLKANGRRVTPSRYGRTIGAIKEFPIPPSYIEHGRLVLTWDPLNEDFLNWRQHSRLTEVWLIKTADHVR